MNTWKNAEIEYQKKIMEIDLIKKTWKKSRDELSKQWKLGAFYTPEETIVYLSNKAFNHLYAEWMLLNLDIRSPHEIKVLEPSVGLWSFIPVIVDLLIPLYENFYKNDTSISWLNEEERRSFILTSIFRDNIYMCDIDTDIIPLLKERLYDILGPIDNDFNEFNIFVWNFLENDFNWMKFDIIIGNPPYGVDVNNNIDKDKSKRILSSIDKKFNKRWGLKIKKESYSYFMVHAIELLKNNWCLSFITSDTFLTLGTFLGLRQFMLNEWQLLNVSLSPKNLFAPFTTTPTVSFTFIKGWTNDIIKLQKIKNKEHYILEEKIVSRDISICDINSIPNKPLYFDSYNYKQYFTWKVLGDILKTVGGLTTWNNSLFVEEYNKRIHNDLIWETYEFYNKSLPGCRWFSEPKFVIKWVDNWQNLRDYKKSTWKWYLQGMWGQENYFKEWLAINLIWSKINARYIEKDKYIFDAWSPMVVFNEWYESEILFILWYLNSEIASTLLKNVINHTRNIQPKNIEALPYPIISIEDKKNIIVLVKEILENYSDKDLVLYNTKEINKIFEWLY